MIQINNDVWKQFDFANRRGTSNSNQQSVPLDVHSIYYKTLASDLCPSSVEIGYHPASHTISKVDIPESIG